jgi:hypothetical protein
MMAIVPAAMTPTTKISRVTQTSQAAPDPAIRSAQTSQNRIFVVYVILILLGVLATIALWSSGNRLQGVIKSNADARIAEFGATAQKAIEHIEVLETDKLKLQNDLAVLQAVAADAKTAQKNVEIALSKQQEKTAKAEKELADLKETVRPRKLTPKQEAALTALLRGDPKGPVMIDCVMGDGEGNAFATQISSILNAAGWPVEKGPNQAVYSGGDPTGFGIIVKSATTAPSFAGRLQQAFFSIGIPLAGAENSTLPEGKVQILVGHKPFPAN